MWSFNQKLEEHDKPLHMSLVFLAVALTLLLAQTGLLLYLGTLVTANESQQEVSNVGILQLREAFDDLLDAESGQRGYLLSHDENYLTPYNRAITRIDGHFGKARQALADTDNKTAVAQVDALLLLKILKLAELAETIRLGRTANFEGAENLLRNGTGKQQMDQIRTIMDELLSNVRLQHKLLNESSKNGVHWAGYLVISTGAVLALLVGFATLLLLQIIRKHNHVKTQLESEATLDSLTGLPNRRLLLQWLDRLMGQALRGESELAVLFLDLDGFKCINDQLGHHVGDAVLKTASARLTAVLRTADLLARNGGDEFVVVVSGSATVSALQGLSDRILGALSQPLLDELSTYALSASIGVAIYPEHGTDVTTLLKAADTAMYEAKRLGKGRLSFAV